MPPVVGEKMSPAVRMASRSCPWGSWSEGEAPGVARARSHSALRQLFTDVAWGQLDYLVVDPSPRHRRCAAQPGAVVPLTGGIIVSTPQAVSLADARRGLTAFQRLDVPVMGIVENMAGDVFGEGGGEQAAAVLGVPFLGRICLESSIRAGGDAGEPAVSISPTPSRPRRSAHWPRGWRRRSA